MRPAVLGLVLVAPLLAGLAVSVSEQECGWFDGLGQACRVEGGFELVLPDGERLFTHGLDPVPAEDVRLQLAAPPRDPPCAFDPLAEYHNHMIYAHPVDKPNRGAELTPVLRAHAAEANGLTYAEGASLGAPVEYTFLCGPDGEVSVSVVTLPLPRGQAAYTQLVYALQAMGFDNPRAKYWVWVDDRSSCGCAGIAAAPNDPDRSPMNGANGGPLFGANYGYSAFVGMHENGHNMGAVNSAAPDQSGGRHCNDGLDVMCYPDGGWNSSYTDQACVGWHRWDCDKDSYFHPDPPARSFLDRKWNLAAPVNRFVQGCLLAEDIILVPGGVAEVAVPSSCAGHRYAIYGADPLAAASIGPNLYLNEFGVCWYAGATELSCPTNNKPWGHEGRVPAGADRAVVTRIDGPDGRSTLSVI